MPRTDPQDHRAAPTKGRPIFDARFCAEADRKYVLAAAVLAASMGFIDGTVVPIAMPAIRAELGASLAQATWINNAYMVPLAALILAAGAFGDRFGLARVFSLGIGLFIVMSLVCALAPTPELLITARLAQGAGAAMMIPGCLAIVSRAYPRDIRGQAIGRWAAASAFTTALGPIIAGLALSFGGDAMWRWIFAINLPLGLAALWLIRRGVATDTRRPDQPIDTTGAVLAVSALGALAWGLTQLQGQASVMGAAALIGGLVGLVAFIVQEWRSRVPMLPLSLFRSATFAAANVATFALYFGMSAILFFLPMLTVAGWEITEIEAVIAFAPVSIFVALLSTRFGRLTDRIGPAPVVATGSIIVAGGYALLAWVIPGQSYWTGVVPAMTVQGFGMAMVVAPLSTAVMAAAADRQSGTASGVNNAFSRIAGLIAVAAMGPLAASVYASNGGQFSYGETLGHPDHVEAMGHAMTAIAWVSAALAAIAALAALAFIRRS